MHLISANMYVKSFSECKFSVGLTPLSNTATHMHSEDAGAAQLQATYPGTSQS